MVELREFIGNFFLELIGNYILSEKSNGLFLFFNQGKCSTSFYNLPLIIISYCKKSNDGCSSVKLYILPQIDFYIKSLRLSVQNNYILHRNIAYCTVKYLSLYKKLALTYLRKMLIGQGQ